MVSYGLHDCPRQPPTNGMCGIEGSGSGDRMCLDRRSARASPATRRPSPPASNPPRVSRREPPSTRTPSARCALRAAEQASPASVRGMTRCPYACAA